MKIHLKTNTGQGITIQGTITVSDLPQDIAQQVQEFIKPDVLQKAETVPKNPNMVDMQEYEITLISDDPKYESNTYRFTDGGCTEELIEILDNLIHEIIIKKKKKRL